MVIKARWVHVIPTPSTTTAPLPSTSAQSSPFHCINIKLHKHSIILTLQPGPEVVGGAHFLITDASYIVTHHCSCENSWSLESFRLQGFSHLNNPTPTPGTRVHSFRLRSAICANTKYAHAHTKTHTQTHAHASPSGGTWPWRRSSECPHEIWTFSMGCLTHTAARVLLRTTSYEIEDVNVNKINLS